MPFADQIDASAPSRTGLRNPNYRPEKPMEFNPHPFFAPHERAQYFEDNPRQAFQAFQPRFGGGDMERYFQSSGFSPIYNEYLGGVGRDVMAGEMPDQGFSEYLRDYDFRRKYHEQNPGATERREAMLNPRFRRLY